MTYRVGDSSFTRDGRASVVVSRDRAQGTVEVEKEGKNLMKPDVLATLTA